MAGGTGFRESPEDKRLKEEITDEDRAFSETTGGSKAARDFITPLQTLKNRKLKEAEGARETEAKQVEGQKKGIEKRRPRGRAATVFSRNDEEQETSLARRTLLGF